MYLDEHRYLGADAVVAAVQQRAEVSQVSADGVYRRAVFDVHVNEGRDESALSSRPETTTSLKLTALI